MTPWLLALSLAQAGCSVTTEPEVLEGIVTLAEKAYADLDEETFLEQVDTALIRVSCLSAPASPELAARLHRLVAVRRWGEDPEQATLSLQAAARAAPELGVEDLLGPSHPLVQRWDPSAKSSERVASPVGADLRLDGSSARRRAREAPVLIQVVDGPDVRLTQLVAPGAPLPRYESVPLARAPLRWTAAGTAAGAGVLYGLSWTQARRFDDPALDEEALRGVRARTNGLLVGSSGLLVASVTSAILSVVVR